LIVVKSHNEIISCERDIIFLKYRRRLDAWIFSLIAHMQNEQNTRCFGDIICFSNRKEVEQQTQTADGSMPEWQEHDIYMT